MTQLKATYYVNAFRGGRLGVAGSLKGAESLIKKKGRLFTKYDVIRSTAKGAEIRLGTYTLKLSGYRSGNKPVLTRN